MPSAPTKFFWPSKFFFGRLNLFLDVQNSYFDGQNILANQKILAGQKNLAGQNQISPTKKKIWTAKNFLVGQKIFGRPKKIWTDRWHRHKKTFLGALP